MGIKTIKGIKSYILLIGLFSAMGSSAQNIEFGLYGGVSNYMGDVSEQKMKWDQTHPSIAVMGRYNISPKLTFKGFVGYGMVSGADSLAKAPANKIRNTNFTSVIYEFSVHMEYNLVRNNLSTRGPKPFVPYIFGGLGIFHFNPKTMFQGKEYELQPLGTEGQGTTIYNERKKYNLTTVCVPIGVGIKKKITSYLSMGIEAGLRFTFTNYLDDVGGVYADNLVVASAYGPIAGALSNRTGEVTSDVSFQAKENDKRTTIAGLVKNDMYFMAGISLTYIFRHSSDGCPKF
ncbi:MAG: DUF6089 family protein [Bacteroidota bacterium]